MLACLDIKAYRLTCNQLNKIPLPRPVSFLLELVRWTQVLNRHHSAIGPFNCFKLAGWEFKAGLAGNLKHIPHQAHCSERALYISLKLTASVE